MAFTRMCAVVGVCFLSVQATAESPEEDDLACLLQKRMHQSKEHSFLKKGKDPFPSHLTIREIKEHTPSIPFDCVSYPKLCQEPFNCQVEGTDPLPGTTKSNVHAWCPGLMTPGYEGYIDYVSSCVIDNDLVLGAQNLYKETVAGHFGEDVPNYDASYCFMEGLCLDEAVTNDTTTAQAEALCEDRFGDQIWTETLDYAYNPSDYEDDGTMNSKDLTTVILKVACQSGNYHCDVMYCKETYCKNPQFVEKYGHVLVDNGFLSQGQLDEYKNTLS